MAATPDLTRPLPAGADGPISSVDVSLLSGSGLSVVDSPTGDLGPLSRCELQLTPDKVAIIGRAEGHAVEYLDPALRPTRRVPGTGQTVLHSGGQGRDIYVSRGHFMLRAVPGGVLLVNGVPRRGGGLRPPLNGTRLVAPVARRLSPGEEYLIASGSSVVLLLPNGAEVRLDAR